jgi:glycosyltransferase involved in cell wall biosynthesis
MFRTGRFVRELVDRLARVCPAGTDLVMVDDACPEQSWRVAAEVSTDLSAPGVRLDRHVGQHAAVLIGLRATSADYVAVLDADLQDRPEAIPLLLDALQHNDRLGAVAAKRSGRYATSGQRITARCYRAAVTVLSGGRVAYGAGMFLVMRRSTRERVLALDDPLVPLVPAISRAGMRVAAVPVPRDARPSGGTSHSGTARLRIAARGLVTLTPCYAPIRRRRAVHWDPPSVTMVPVGSARRAATGAES